MPGKASFPLIAFPTAPASLPQSDSSSTKFLPEPNLTFGCSSHCPVQAFGLEILFSAVLDDPVIVGEKTIVPRGALITGSVMAAKASAESHDPGYLRVTLVSMVVNGKTIPLRTSSVFAKGGSYVSSPIIIGSGLSSVTAVESSSNHFKGDVRFSTGHRLTFRLAQTIQSQS